MRSHVINENWTATAGRWKLEPYRGGPSGSKPHPTTSGLRSQEERDRRKTRLMDAIAAGEDLELGPPTALWNIPIEWPVEHLAKHIEAWPFYKVIFQFEQRRTNLQTTRIQVQMRTTPLIWAVAYPSRETKSAIDQAKRLKIIQKLLESGAQRHVRDSGGLSAYDHARILKRSEAIVITLDPFLERKNVLSELVRQGDRKAIVDGMLKDKNGTNLATLSSTTILALDRLDLSPLALALHRPDFQIGSKLLKAGASAFAVFDGHATYCHALAALALDGDWYTTVSQESSMFDPKGFRLEDLFPFPGSVRAERRKMSETWEELAQRTQTVKGYPGDWCSLLIMHALANNSGLAQRLIEDENPMGHISQSRSAAIAMYVAVRFGHLDVVKVLHPYRPNSNTDYHHLSLMSAIESTASHWKRCRCRREEPTLRPVTFSMYALELASAISDQDFESCSSCSDRRRAYYSIHKLLQPAAISEFVMASPVPSA